MENNLNRYEFTNIPMPEAIDTPVRNFASLISDIKKGNIRIPNFQRKYIWQPDQVLELLDSVWNGYPIGSILVWETTEKLDEHNPLKLRLEELSKGKRKQYLLDGQQRLVTLYEVIHNILELGKKRKIEYTIYFDLKKKKFEIYKKKDLASGKTDPKIKKWFLPMGELMKIDYNTRSAIQNNKILTKFSKNPNIIRTYVDLFIRFNSLNIPTITTGQKLSVACKIFERLNNTGTPLTIVDLMVATTYNPKFNLREKLELLNSELDNLDFAISDRVILQCMSSCIKNGTTRDHIIGSSLEIENKWKTTTEALKSSIDFLKQHCPVPVSRFLPNEILLPPLAYFFYKNGNKQLSNANIKKLKRYFWFNVLSQRYVQSQDVKAEEDIKNMDKVLSNSKEGVFEYYVQKIDAEIIKTTEMAFGSAFARGILCFLASKTPLEFENNTPIKLDITFANANLKQLHHIFPQNFIKTEFKKGSKEMKYTNSIANISLISQGTNRRIWDTKPSIYFEEFEKQNKKLDVALKSHLIADLNSLGLRKNEFMLFIDRRSKLIAEEIDKFVESLR